MVLPFLMPMSYKKHNACTFWTHTHTHTYIYIYIYICVCVCVYVTATAPRTEDLNVIDIPPYRLQFTLSPLRYQPHWGRGREGNWGRVAIIRGDDDASSSHDDLPYLRLMSNTCESRFSVYLTILLSIPASLPTTSTSIWTSAVRRPFFVGPRRCMTAGGVSWTPVFRLYIPLFTQRDCCHQP